MLTLPHMIIIAGPTGVGKTAFAEQLALEVGGEIVNADMGQCYVPLTIGTAKPDWRASSIAQHGFDTIAQPRDLTVAEYREQLALLLNDIWQRGKLPILVGGSSFYLASLFFPPKADVPAVPVVDQIPDAYLWLELDAIDPERASRIDPQDYFRIRRALEIWHATGTKPSLYVPTFEPLAPYTMIFLTRSTQELNRRIEERVRSMLHHGWLEEVQALKGTAWEPFLLRKKIIGYDDILTFLDKKEPTAADFNALTTRIVQRTRQYAKRQRTFWRMLEKKLQQRPHTIETVNISEIDVQEYLQKLIKELGGS